MRIERSDFGSTSAGTPVDRWRFGDPDGVEVEMVSYGARVHALWAPDRDGVRADVVLGCADTAAYEADRAYIGATVGRFANRIRGASFTLDGATFRLPVGQQGHTVHGGPGGFSARVWSGTPIEEDGRVGIRFGLVSEHLDMGFPGRVEVSATYTLDPGGRLRIDYHATTDQATVLNLTNHVYLNLVGAGDVSDHRVRIGASSVTEKAADGVPNGAIVPVSGTALDLRTPTRLGDRLDADDPAIRAAGGFDCTFVLDDHDPDAAVADVVEPRSGRRVTVRTDQPGLQLYTANAMPPGRGKHDQQYAARAGLCLETQHFPDSPNQPSFPSTVLRPGRGYRSWTSYSVGTV